uniref:Endoplasmic reticulum junction formation protein lunapark n=1 Tax=Parascaris univalens TaxID=6257 RepID=A0A915A6Y7_PARUN
MGNILRRRKKVVTEELDEIQKRTKLLEDDISRTINSKRSIQWLCSLTLFALTGLSVAIVFFYEPDRKRRAAYAMLSSFGGLLMMYVTSVMTNGYYEWSIGRKRSAYEEMAKKKVALLEQVKETETFKVAKEILDKYGDPATPPPEPTSASHREKCSATVKMPFSPPRVGIDVIQDVGVKRELEAKQCLEDRQPVDMLLTNSAVGQMTVANVGRRPPRPFLRQQRTLVEKFVDFLLGDGPSHRFALVCASCYAHNGMAREEEFDYFSYRCWVCGTFNPARKQRIISQPHILTTSLTRAKSESAFINRRFSLCETAAPKQTRQRSESLQRPPLMDTKRDVTVNESANMASD